MNEIEPHMLGQQDFSSDMLLALENLERMFHAYRYCMNEHAANAVLFGSDLKAAGLGEKIEGYLSELLAGPGAVRATLVKYLG